MSNFPHYRWQPWMENAALLDEFGIVESRQDRTALECSERNQWIADERNIITQCLKPDGTLATDLDMVHDGKLWSQRFGRDVRSLHTFNHDHNCTTTCFKYLKAKAKEAVEKAAKLGKEVVQKAGDKAAVLASACRFFFFRIMSFEVVENGKKVIRRIRRKGKALVLSPFITSSNAHNEFGRAMVLRCTPFRSTSTDVGQAATRSNFDFQFMERSIPEIPEDDGASQPIPQILPALAEALYGIRRRLPLDQTNRKVTLEKLPAKR